MSKIDSKPNLPLNPSLMRKMTNKYSISRNLNSLTGKVSNQSPNSKTEKASLSSKKTKFLDTSKTMIKKKKPKKIQNQLTFGFPLLKLNKKSNNKINNSKNYKKKSNKLGKLSHQNLFNTSYWQNLIKKAERASLEKRRWIIAVETYCFSALQAIKLHFKENPASVLPPSRTLTES